MSLKYLLPLPCTCFTKLIKLYLINFTILGKDFSLNFMTHMLFGTNEFIRSFAERGIWLRANRIRIKCHRMKEEGMQKRRLGTCTFSSQYFNSIDPMPTCHC